MEVYYYADFDPRRTPTRTSLGTASLSISSLLLFSSVAKVESPVTLPPGRARLATRPAPTGSPAIAITMGIVVVARLAANAGGVVRHDQINLRRTSPPQAQAGPFALSKPVLDGNVLSLDPSKLAQLLPERIHENRATGSSASIQETYAEDFPRLLLRLHDNPTEGENESDC